MSKKSPAERQQSIIRKGLSSNYESHSVRYRMILFFIFFCWLHSAMWSFGWLKRWILACENGGNTSESTDLWETERSIQILDFVQLFNLVGHVWYAENWTIFITHNPWRMLILGKIILMPKGRLIKTHNLSERTVELCLPNFLKVLGECVSYFKLTVGVWRDSLGLWAFCTGLKITLVKMTHTCTTVYRIFTIKMTIRIGFILFTCRYCVCSSRYSILSSVMLCFWNMIGWSVLLRCRFGYYDQSCCHNNAMTLNGYLSYH